MSCEASGDREVRRRRAEHVDVALSRSGPPSILSKAFAILETFSRDRTVLSLSQISRRSHLPKSTAHRVVGMLVELGALERDGEDYRLGSRIFSFGTRSPHVALREAAWPHLQHLAVCTGQTVHLAVLDDRDVLYLAKLGGRPELSPASVGDRLAAHTTALGKSILAFSDARVAQHVMAAPLERRTPATITDPDALVTALAEARTNRIATDREEVARGLRCVSVPVLSGLRAVAAISVAYPTAGGSGHAFVGPLQATAVRIARSIQTADATADVACTRTGSTR